MYSRTHLNITVASSERKHTYTGPPAAAGLDGPLPITCTAHARAPQRMLPKCSRSRCQHRPHLPADAAQLPLPIARSDPAGRARTRSRPTGCLRDAASSRADAVRRAPDPPASHTLLHSRALDAQDEDIVRLAAFLGPSPFSRRAALFFFPSFRACFPSEQEEAALLFRRGPRDARADERKGPWHS